MSLPRYFTPAPQSEPELHSDDAELAAQTLDVFGLEGDATASRTEYAVVVDALGRLQLWPARERTRLSPAVQAQLSYQELTAPLRQLRCSELHLFELQLIEQPADAPGLNDPVYLYGTLVGPFGTNAAPLRRRGQLALTRADLLGGALGTRPFGFRYAAQFGRPEARFHHLLVPAEREEELASGRGLVLAYPYPPPEAADPSNPGNEWLMRQILSDVLGAMAEELRAEQGGFFKRLFQSAAPEVQPPEGATLEQLFELAQRAWDFLKRSGAQRTAVLFERVHVGTSAPSRSPSAGAPPSIAAPAVAPRIPPRPAQPARASNDPPGWMRDFIASHAHAGAPRSKLTGMARVEPPAPPPRPSSSPEWMADFAPPAEGTASRPESPRPPAPRPGSTSDRPDWMKDFES